MMTAQDIREKYFEKARFNGYDMADVDSFLEEAAADFSALHKENAVLKSKLKVLVEKIEEYRSTEDAMRMALLSAQKMSTEITEEARQKSDAVVAKAQQSADELLSKAKTDVKTEEAKLVEAKRSSVEFIEKMRLICTTQLDFLDALNTMRLDVNPAAVPVPSAPDVKKLEADKDSAADDEKAADDIDSTVKKIESSVTRLVDEPHLDIMPDLEDNLPEEEDFLDELDRQSLSEEGIGATRPFDITSDSPDAEDNSRPAFNFDNLRFGEGFDPGE